MPWSATFLGSTDEVKLTIGPNKHTAEYIEDTEDCDSFTLQFTDFFEVREVDEGGRVIGGTLHEFLYEAKLRYTGPRITGTFLYQDEWAGLVDDQLGSLTVLEANLTLTAEE